MNKYKKPKYLDALNHPLSKVVLQCIKPYKKELLTLTPIMFIYKRGDLKARCNIFYLEPSCWKVAAKEHQPIHIQKPS